MTRAELWDFIRRYETFRRRHVWWRRCWRWLLEAAIPEEADRERDKLESELRQR